MPRYAVECVSLEELNISVSSKGAQTNDLVVKNNAADVLGWAHSHATNNLRVASAQLL